MRAAEAGTESAAQVLRGFGWDPALPAVSILGRFPDRSRAGADPWWLWCPHAEPASRSWPWPSVRPRAEVEAETEGEKGQGLGWEAPEGGAGWGLQGGGEVSELRGRLRGTVWELPSGIQKLLEAQLQVGGWEEGEWGSSSSREG